MKAIITFIMYLVIPMIICLAAGKLYGQEKTFSTYQCPPCGCDADDKQFEHAGDCDRCGMELTPVTFHFVPLKKLEKPLNVAILVYHHAQVLDYAAPYDIFIAGGQNFNVYTVAEYRKPVTTMPNLSVNPQYDIHNAPKADILIIPGGMWTELSDATKNWITRQAKEADHVLSICTGAFILADLGLLDGLEATTHSSGTAILEKNYTKISKVHRDKRFVDNGKIITSGGVTAGIDASIYLISKILGNAWVDAIKRNLEFKQ